MATATETSDGSAQSAAERAADGYLKRAKRRARNAFPYVDLACRARDAAGEWRAAADPSYLGLDSEDVHSFVEARLGEVVGELAGQGRPRRAGRHRPGQRTDL